MPQPEFTVQEAFLIPNETYAGISKGLSIPVTYDGAADYLNPVMRDLQDFGNIHMDMVLPGGSYRFGSGSVSAPSISFAADTDNGFYYIAANNIGFSIGGAKTWDYQSAKTETTLNLLPSASDLDLGSATQRWDLFGQDVDIDTSLTLSFITANRVLWATTGGLVTHDADLTFDGTILTALQQLRVGSATDTATQGAFVAGLTGAARMYFDVAAPYLRLYGTDGANNVSIRSVTGNDVALLITKGQIRLDDRGDSFGAAMQFRAGNNPRFDFYCVQSDGSFRLFHVTNLAGAASSVIALQVSDDDSVQVAKWLEVGTATDAATQGDFAAGLTGAARLFYDQSTPAAYLYDSSGAISVQLSQVGATETVFNEVQADIDFRVEGDSASHMVFVDATSTTENIALLTTVAPNWQSMDKGLFIGNADTAPSGNPASGGFLYVESGALKYRGSSGTITEIAPA